MKFPSRRSFLASSAVTAAGLAGISSGSSAKQVSTDFDLADGAESALGLVPAESAADGNYPMVILADVGEDEHDHGYEVREVLRSVDDLEADDVSHVAVARVAKPRGQIGVAVGSFDRPDPGEETGEQGDWRLAEANDRSYATAEDRVAVASGEESADLTTAVVDVDAGDTEAFLDVREDADTAVELLSDQPLVYFAADVEGMGFPGIDPDTLDAFAAGFAQAPNTIEGTVENRYVLFPATGVDFDDETVEEIVTELEPGVLAEMDVDRQNDIVHATVVAEEPPERDREAAPDAQIDAEVDHDEGVVTFRHCEGEPIDADELELWHDGERSDDAAIAEFDVFEAGDELVVATDPLATVTLRWFDEDENAFYTYATFLVGQNAFEVDYDFDAERLEIEYVGERTADPEKLTLQSRSDRDVKTLDGFAGEYDALSAGDATTVDGVGVGDRVSLELDVPNEPRRSPSRLVSYRVRPPRIHLHRRPEEGVVARYHDDQARDAAEFRLLVDGQEAETQFADLANTVERGDTVELGDYDIGTELAVEWTVPDDPMEIGDLVLSPHVRTRMEYDGDDGTLRIVHDEGDVVDADDLELRVGDEPTDVQPADEHDRFEPGDELNVEAEPFAESELSWTLEDVEREYTLGRTVIAADTFEAEYEPDADEVKVTYVGEQQADPERLGIHRRTPGSRGAGEPAPLFAEAHDALTTGDAITLTDVEVEERIRVVLRTDEGGYRHSVFRFTPEPRFAFSFKSREDGVVAVYSDDVARRAAEFRILADGEETAAQPVDEHDVLESGDEIELGDFESGTELVVEWTVPEDPLEVRDHTITPNAAFEVVYDDEDGKLTVTHESGDELAAADVQLFIRPTRSEPVAWGDEGTVAEGDSRTVELEEDPEVVFVVFRERKLLHEREISD
ncbi:hypothetical protein CV102_18765 [Natronococcus pandeyae]|uniref:Uncharacterized protein n=1 Tax=Natronococcus pandeyae TaxID=2055836 RepID=A0A8J8TP89_9EURY|nr:hypothetical protein [Natronococcus pandeyae]TYL37163.1 hypothetical protein CV102_18765 [Natronococcus pandeyae]